MTKKIFVITLKKLYMLLNTLQLFVANERFTDEITKINKHSSNKRHFLLFVNSSLIFCDIVNVTKN